MQSADRLTEGKKGHQQIVQWAMQVHLFLLHHFNRVLVPPMKEPDQGSTTSALTIGERTGLPRAVLWLLAVWLPSCLIGFTLVGCWDLYTNPVSTLDSLWLLLPFLLSGIFMALVPAIAMYMSLYLPDAPVAIQRRISEVGLSFVGYPLMVLAVLTAYLGHAWMVVAMVCLFVVIIYGAIAFWVCLVRTYGK